MILPFFFFVLESRADLVLVLGLGFVSVSVVATETRGESEIAYPKSSPAGLLITTFGIAFFDSRSTSCVKICIRGNISYVQPPLLGDLVWERGETRY